MIFRFLALDMQVRANYEPSTWREPESIFLEEIWAREADLEIITIPNFLFGDGISQKYVYNGRRRR